MSTNSQNGDGTAAAGGANAQNAAPGMNILGQYVKDFSFENPNAPRSLAPRETSPSINIQVNVNANPLSDNEFEVSLVMNAKGGTDDDLMFNVELTYCGVFRIQNVPQEHLHPFVLIECPRMLFPFARQIVAEAVRAGGFPPLMIDPIDFAALYQHNAAKNAGGEGAAPTPNA
ncbi:preprotein translocase subunit SecB [Rhodobium orientis]|uniref:Protein-export protein SecB n=1 Tax=Rhodobium orientis TaxID=34017 RepID=A0A327JTH0_9HYPH|nr:protein-export chaperone SecB [Rhodobium orientis]MBB4304293.1 preprotein translocase subunit SecB [Rhodobium orientis]MBK5948213.1 protein-export chaperone SecB [Rhodobium orientis]RAI28796.1 protein-export chaperone SecB [Rhodobium orientis]